MTTTAAERETGQQRTGLASIREAETFLRLKRSSIYKLLDNGGLTRVHLEGIAAVRIRWSELYKIAE